MNVIVLCYVTMPTKKIKMEKFLEKNKEPIDKMNQFIEDNKGKIHMIITSTELFEFITSNYGLEHIVENNTKYKGIRLMKEPYFPANKVGFVMKENNIEFDVPCLCGFYKGEGHNHGN